MGEEPTVRTDFLDLGGAELMEVESVVSGCREPLHKWEVLRQSRRHLSHAIQVRDQLHTAELDAILQLLVCEDISSRNGRLSCVWHERTLHELLQLA